MPHYVLGWAEIALGQFETLELQQQLLIEARIRILMDEPDGPDCSYDTQSDLWTTTDAAGAGLITYVFRSDRRRLIVLRLVY